MPQLHMKWKSPPYYNTAPKVYSNPPAISNCTPPAGNVAVKGPQAITINQPIAIYKMVEM